MTTTLEAVAKIPGTNGIEIILAGAIMLRIGEKGCFV